MKCPKCGHCWRDKAKSEGGKKSKRQITPEQQEKMQAARRKKLEQCMRENNGHFMQVFWRT